MWAPILLLGASAAVLAASADVNISSIAKATATLMDATSRERSAVLEECIREKNVWSTLEAYESCAATTQEPKAPASLLPATDGMESNLQWPSIMSILSDWVTAHIKNPESPETWSTYLASERSLFQKNPKSAMGGRLLELSAWRSAYATAVEGVASTMRGPAIELTVQWLTEMCNDHDVQAAYHATALEHPHLRTVQDDVVSRIARIPHYANHPKKAELIACYTALGNTTDVKPYSQDIVQASSPSFLQLGTKWFRS